MEKGYFEFLQSEAVKLKDASMKTDAFSIIGHTKNRLGINKTLPVSFMVGGVRAVRWVPWVHCYILTLALRG